MAGDKDKSPQLLAALAEPVNLGGVHIQSGASIGISLAPRDVATPDSGEAAEFDTRVPHWFGDAGPEPVEFLSLFGRQGERVHLRAQPSTTRTTRRGDAAPHVSADVHDSADIK